MKRINIALIFLALSATLWAEKRIYSLKDCVNVGLEKYEPLKLAEEEVELARLKKQEAFRGYFPALSLQAEETDGIADNNVSPDFEEQKIGGALTHNLYEGGRIHATYKQTYFSHQASERSREKTWQDFIYNVRESYWNLASAQLTLSEREEARDEIKKDLKMVTEQYVLDLAVKQQFLAVKAQFLQANTSLKEAQKKLAQARWNLAKALGLPTQPDFEVETKIPFKKIEVDLKECLLLARTHRPDLLMQENLMKSSRQGRRVAFSVNKPKVSVNSFYGRSGAAFESENLNLREDWQVNAKLTQRFLGNSLDVQGSQVKTSPKIGQSSRTETKTKGLNLRLLDSLKQRTDRKQADLEYRRAKFKLSDLEKDIAIDVENAFYNLSQATLQVEFTEEDLKLAEEELKVAESKRRYGLAEVLEVARARNRYAESKSARVQALSNYQIGLAVLNRAVGVVDKFKVQ